MKRKTAEKLRPVLEMANTFLKKTSVSSFGNAINLFTFGKIFEKSDLKQLKDKKIIDIINESFLSLLDGALEKHPEGSAYYNVLTRFAKIPKNVVNLLKISNEKVNFLSGEFENFMWEILTGGEIDNNYLLIDRK